MLNRDVSSVGRHLMFEKAFLVSIRGRVHGVGFRMWTEREAQAMRLRGWVRNERDGSVTALVGGPEEVVASMIERFWNGPRDSAVISVEAKPVDPADLPSGFTQRR
jgi:acylphosphatase